MCLEYFKCYIDSYNSSICDLLKMHGEDNIKSSTLSLKQRKHFDIRLHIEDTRI
jgi:hypothetical protein